MEIAGASTADGGLNGGTKGDEKTWKCWTEGLVGEISKTEN